MDPHSMRSIVCRVLREREDPGNWTAFPNVDCEVRGHLDSCEWYKVYDIVEALHAAVELEDERSPKEDGTSRAEHFASELNDYFRTQGIGWQLVDGRVQVRGPALFERAVSDARSVLEQAGRLTAANEIHQALMDLSQRPQPDLTGALQHGLAALECAVRDVCGDEHATLGQLLKRYPESVPPPLDGALTRIWGFASEQGRHLREGREPVEAEVVLAVEVAAAAISYLGRRFSRD